MKTLLFIVILALNSITTAFSQESNATLLYQIANPVINDFDGRTQRDFYIERQNRINQLIEMEQRQEIINQLEQLNTHPIIFDHEAQGGVRR